MDLGSLVKTYWPLLSLGASVVSGAAVFLRDVLTIRKLRSEIQAIQRSQKEGARSVIEIATAEEISRYSNRYPNPKLHARAPSRGRRLVEDLGYLGILRVSLVIVIIIESIGLVLDMQRIMVAGASLFIYFISFALLVWLVDRLITGRLYRNLRQALRDLR